MRGQAGTVFAALLLLGCGAGGGKDLSEQEIKGGDAAGFETRLDASGDLHADAGFPADLTEQDNGPADGHVDGGTAGDAHPDGQSSDPDAPTGEDVSSAVDTGTPFLDTVFPPDETDVSPGIDWTDPLTSLTWQNPPSADPMDLAAAKQYCDELKRNGHEDWRLPTIDELRSLVRGCPSTETGGACNVKEGCLAISCRNEACYSCDQNQGPAGGCYWPGEMVGICDYYWSASAADTEFAWILIFQYGAPGYFVFDYGAAWVRCVR